MGKDNEGAAYQQSDRAFNESALRRDYTNQESNSKPSEGVPKYDSYAGADNNRCGTEYLYGQLIELLGFNRKYGVENPGYGKMYRYIRAIA